MEHQGAPLFPIPIPILNHTVEYAYDFSLRLQVEAAALAGLDSPQARALAQERLKQAEDINQLFQYYSSL